MSGHADRPPCRTQLRSDGVSHPEITGSSSGHVRSAPMLTMDINQAMLEVSSGCLALQRPWAVAQQFSDALRCSDFVHGHPAAAAAAAAPSAAAMTCDGGLL